MRRHSPFAVGLWRRLVPHLIRLTFVRPPLAVGLFILKGVFLMPTLTLARAKELLATTTTEAHLFEPAIGVSAAMGAMARHFGQDPA